MREIRIRIDNLNNLGLSSEVWSCSQSREVRADEWVSVYPPFFLKAVHGLQFCSLITPEAKPRESWVWDLPGRPSETSCSYPPKSKAKQSKQQNIWVLGICSLGIPLVHFYIDFELWMITAASLLPLSLCFLCTLILCTLESSLSASVC